MILYSAADELKQRSQACWRRDLRSSWLGSSVSGHGESPCPPSEALSRGADPGDPRRSSRRPPTRWPDNLVDAKPDRACPGHGAAGVGGGEGKPERRLENQASNVLKLKARPLLLGPREPLPRH
jgi:hypothetical protein